MAAADDLDEVVKQYHLAAREFVNANPEPYKMVFSHRDDVSVANPLWPCHPRWKQVAATMERAASLYRDGEFTAFENVVKYVTPELAFIVEVERFRVKIAGREEVAPVALRTTSVLRPEDGIWKVMHRHVDSINTAQPAESIIQK